MQKTSSDSKKRHEGPHSSWIFAHGSTPIRLTMVTVTDRRVPWIVRGQLISLRLKRKVTVFQNSNMIYTCSNLCGFMWLKTPCLVKTLWCFLLSGLVSFLCIIYILYGPAMWEKLIFVWNFWCLLVILKLNVLWFAK